MGKGQRSTRPGHFSGHFLKRPLGREPCEPNRFPSAGFFLLTGVSPTPRRCRGRRHPCPQTYAQTYSGGRRSLLWCGRKRPQGFSVPGYCLWGRQEETCAACGPRHAVLTARLSVIAWFQSLLRADPQCHRGSCWKLDVCSDNVSARGMCNARSNQHTWEG